MTQTLPLYWSAIEWSDTPPTVPGWYAAKFDGLPMFVLVNISRHDGYLVGTMNGVFIVAHAQRCGYESSCDAEFSLDTFQFGPLIAPLAEKQP